MISLKLIKVENFQIRLETQPRLIEINKLSKPDPS